MTNWLQVKKEGLSPTQGGVQLLAAVEEAYFAGVRTRVLLPPTLRSCDDDMRDAGVRAAQMSEL